MRFQFSQNHYLVFPLCLLCVHMYVDFYSLLSSDNWSWCVILVGLTSDCITMGKAVAWSATFCFFPNSLLFLIRVRAVYHDCRIVRLLFTILWFSVVAAAFAQPFCVHFAPVGLSAGCVATAVEPYCSSGLVVAMVHDTSVLFAISTRLILDGLVNSLTGRLKAFLSGEGMSNLSRLLLQTGQLYYLWVLYALRPCNLDRLSNLNN